LLVGGWLNRVDQRHHQRAQLKLPDRRLAQVQQTDQQQDVSACYQNEPYQS
jgi:hypothetical protein